MSRTRVALVGAGSMASTFHYPSLAEFPDVELVGLCDLVEPKREQLASRLGIPRTFGDYRQMLEETSPEAVYVLMPPHQLFDIVVDCLKRGLHVFIEKPPGVVTFQTESMARWAARHNCVTMVGFNRRHDPLVNRALDSARATGRITQVQASFFKAADPIYYDGAVEVIVTDTIHAIDLLRYMAGGEVKNVLSVVGQFDSPVPNAWNALVTFDTGVVGILQSNWNVGGRIHTFEIHGVGYSGFVEQLTSLYEVTAADNGRRRLSAGDVMGTDAADPRKLNGFFQQARHFIDCVQQRRQPSNNFADAAATMRLVDAIRGGVAIAPNI